MLSEQGGQAAQPAGGGIAADAGVNHLAGRPARLQPSRQQGDPALFQGHAVGGADTIAEHEDARFAARLGLARRCPGGRCDHGERGQQQPLAPQSARRRAA